MLSLFLYDSPIISLHVTITNARSRIFLGRDYFSLLSFSCFEVHIWVVPFPLFIIKWRKWKSLKQKSLLNDTRFLHVTNYYACAIKNIPCTWLFFFVKIFLLRRSYLSRAFASLLLSEVNASLYLEIRDFYSKLFDLFNDMLFPVTLMIVWIKLFIHITGKYKLSKAYKSQLHFYLRLHTKFNDCMN